ncbi:MAG: hypothetical protein PVJ05_06580 [Candidatus Thorarchaeota archaeon]|jgi:hypothetical protein
MEKRVGVKIGILAFVMFILCFASWLINLILVIPFTGYWTTIPLILLMSAILIILSMILHRIILEYRKSALIDRWYKHSGYSAVIIGFFLCFSIGGDFIFRGVYQLEDAITTVLCFLSGILMIISGIITIHEVKERTEQVDHEK